SAPGCGTHDSRGRRVGSARRRGRPSAAQGDDGAHHHAWPRADPLEPWHRRRRDEADCRPDGGRDDYLDDPDAGGHPSDLPDLAAARGFRCREGRTPWVTPTHTMATGTIPVPSKRSTIARMPV